MTLRTTLGKLEAVTYCRTLETTEIEARVAALEGGGK